MNGKGLDLAGQKFGKLTALKKNAEKKSQKGLIWICECECGNTTEVIASRLRSGKTKSCGCLSGKRFQSGKKGGNKFIDMTGLKFGELTVLRMAEERGSKNSIMWHCKCECGNSKNVNGSNLRQGLTRSCGCLLRGRKPGSSGVIPEELKNMKSVLVRDGLFQVFANGRIFRITEYGILECPQHITNGYKVVSTMVNGKQKHFYAHRLLAEAFIENPENKPQVNHKDGNRSNNDLSNLEWVTAKENVSHAYKTGLAHGMKKGEPCGRCGDPTRAKDNICTNCKRKINSELRKEITVSQIIESVKHFDVSLLTAKQKEIVELRATGKTYEEIGEILGITRQGVESSLKTSQKRMDNVGTLSKGEINEIIRLNKRKERIKTKREKLLSEVSFIDKDIDRIDSILASYEIYRESVEV